MEKGREGGSSKMKLYIRFGSLARFKSLFESSEYLQNALTQTRPIAYSIEVDDCTEIVNLLRSRSINFEISDK